MRSIANIKSISYLKSHAAQISEDLEMNGNPFVITQNGEASMVIESVKQFQVILCREENIPKKHAKK